MEQNKERENNNKRLAILALLLALLALAFGFAAFSRTVEIKNGMEDVGYAVFKGGVLSIDPDKPKNGKVYPTATGGAKAEPATLTENGIININVHFTKPGQSAVYSFYGVNPTKTATFLNNITFGEKECKAGASATNAYVQKACEGIEMIVKVNEDTFKETVDEIDFHALSGESHETISVTINYKKNAQSADGYFSVDFGTSTLTYGELD